MVRVAVIQFDVVPADVSGNEQKAAALLEQAAQEGAQIVVLPELWNCGYALEDLAELAQDMRGSSVKMLQRLAKQHNLFIFGGSIAERKGGKYYNTALVVNSEGEVVEKYRKVHLFPLALHEDEYFNSGDEWCIVPTPWGEMGVILCYDLRFPAFVRNLAICGVKALVVAAQWPAQRAHHWRILVQARAIENSIHVFAANRTGSDESGSYAGHSAIIDALGEVVAGDSTAAGIFWADVDLDQQAEVLSKIPVFESRRHMLDEIDDNRL